MCQNLFHLSWLTSIKGIYDEVTIWYQKKITTCMSRDAGTGGAGGAAGPPNFGAGGAWPPQLLHVGSSGIGDGLPYKVFHNGCY